MKEFSDLVTLQKVLDWAEKQGLWILYLDISGNLRFFYYTRGFWSAEKEMSLKRADIAKNIGDQMKALDSLLYHINVACKQGNKREVERTVSEMRRLYQECSEAGLSWLEMVEYNHVCALILQIQKSSNWKEKCLKLWEDNQILLEEHDEISKSPQIWSSFNFHYNVNLRYLAKHYLIMEDWEKARDMLNRALADSQEKGFQRGQVLVSLYLADLDIKQTRFNEALENLNGLVLGVRIMKDKLALGQLNMLRGDALFGVSEFPEALIAYQDAQCHFRDLEHRELLKSVEGNIQQTKRRINNFPHA